MSKRKDSSNQSISHEEARKALVEGRFDVAGVIRLDLNEVLRLLENFESLKYLVLSDLIQLLSATDRKAIDSTKGLSSAYTTGFPFEVVKTLVMSLLRIPAVQRGVEEDPDDEGQTDEEMKKLHQSASEAARISRDVSSQTESTGAPPSLEVVNKWISASDHPACVRELLEVAREGNPPITLNNNEQLPPIPPMPKCLQSKGRHEVEISVDCYHEGTSSADVKIVSVRDAGDPPAALDGLLNVLLPAKFVDRTGKIRRALLGTQISKRTISATVEVTRAFRPNEGRYNSLTLCKVKASRDLASVVEKEVMQMKLDLGPGD